MIPKSKTCWNIKKKQEKTLKKNKKYQTQEKTSKTWKKICKNMKNITITQKYEKFQKYEKYGSGEGRLGKSPRYLIYLIPDPAPNSIKWPPWPPSSTTSSVLSTTTTLLKDNDQLWAFRIPRGASLRPVASLLKYNATAGLPQRRSGDHADV